MLNAKSVLVNARKFFVHQIFRNAVIVIQGGLRSPANVECRPGVRLAPLHDFDKLIPISHVLEFDKLKRCARHYEAVVIVALNVVERAVKFGEITFGGMRRLISARVNKINFNLQRSIAQQSKQLRFGDGLNRHEVED